MQRFKPALEEEVRKERILRGKQERSKAENGGRNDAGRYMAPTK